MSNHFPSEADLADDTFASKPHSKLHGDLGDAVSDFIDAMGKVDLTGFNSRPTLFDPAQSSWGASDSNWFQFDYMTGTFDAGAGDGTTSGLAALSVGAAAVDLTLSKGGSAGFVEATVDDTAAALTVTGDVGQTDPLLNLSDSDANPILTVAPDGSVGGTAPSDGDTITWDGAQYVARPSRRVLAYTIWTLYRDQLDGAGADPLTVDWSTIARDDFDPGAWMLAIQWQSFGAEFTEDHLDIDTSGGQALVITKYGPTLIFKGDEVDNPTFPFVNGDATLTRYDVWYLRVLDLDAGTWEWDIYRGTPGDSDDDVFTAWNGDTRTAYECPIALIEVPPTATTYATCTLHQGNGLAPYRKWVTPYASWPSGHLTQYFYDLAIAALPLTNTEAGFRVQRGEDPDTIVFIAYLSDGGAANDRVGLYSANGLLRGDRPTIDPGAIAGNETTVLTSVVNALIDLGVVIDGS